MGYLTNSGSGFLSNAVTTVSNVKSYLVNKTGYLVDSIRVGIGDFGQRVLDDGGTVEASAEAAASYREITKDIYDQASLVLFPSGYKDNLLYSHKPVNGSGDFTYTRGTDTATRVGADGYIKKERANLLVQSNQFDTTWATIGTSVTSGQSGYDGSSDAWLLGSNNTAGAYISQNITVSGVQTFSIYAKAGTCNFIYFVVRGSSNIASYFDLENGTIGTAVSTNIDRKIESIANGWYRCSITLSNTDTSVRVYMADADGSTISALGSNIYIQDAQLEEGLVATPYIETTTAPVYEGLTDNLPRIDYTGGTPSILLEPSRQNRLPNSEYFGDWTNTSASFVYNVSNSPQGVKNAIRIIPNSSDFEIKAPVNTAVVSTESTFSVFLKYETGGFEYAVLGSGAPIQRYVFNIAEGTKVGSIGSTSIPDEKASIESYGNGWYRCVVTTNNTGGNKHSIYLSDDGTDIAATGADGTKGMLAWGAQAERENSYATSYIPTYGSSATRAADSLAKYDLEDSTSQTVFFQFKNVGYEGGGGEIVIEKANPVAAIFRIYAQATSGGVVLVQFRTEFPIQTYTFNTGKQTSEVQKVAFSISGTTAKAYCNGQLRHTFTITETEMQVLNWRVQNTKYNTDKLLLFPTALSDDDCEALTAL